MPVADTELLFALNPKDKKHELALELISRMRGIKVPDVVLLEFVVVLRARGRSPREIREALNAFRDIFEAYRIREVKTLDANLLVLQSSIEETYGLTFFDSLVAASALRLDQAVISDDAAFAKVPGLALIPISKHRP
ncbi:PIN domain-containing protein [Infirmifilum lucidum]|uniref:Ribonuclease VapC n=1 Tax=Infirmifilum lucidum TaxID=2776706 RepID=A0A7L9FFT8_9CREN|nr:PIN domain-containing protein [Infirmifilum lucidum]QOJ78678.1 PIN domain-containing protein [Infirmifilum lucidum]